MYELILTAGVVAMVLAAIRLEKIQKDTALMRRSLDAILEALDGSKSNEGHFSEMRYSLDAIRKMMEVRTELDGDKERLAWRKDPEKF
jgi:hypothetical protein